MASDRTTGRDTDGGEAERRAPQGDGGDAQLRPLQADGVDPQIHPFRIQVPGTALDDLRE